MIEPFSSYSYGEFEIEARRIEELVWAACALEAGQRVLFCSFENAKGPIERAIREGVKVTVVETRDAMLREAHKLGAETIRASTSTLPVREGSFDIAVAYHYLHECDPFFHAQIIGELGRVAKRVIVVEPAPPADLLGRKIASLYSRAKRELGQFEYYQTLEYWRKLLTNIRPIIAPSIINFGSIPPREYLHDTINLVVKMIRIGGAPMEDVHEMQALAAASDAQLLPQARFVLFAAATPAEIPDRPRMSILEAQAPKPRTTKRPATVSRPSIPVVSAEVDAPHAAPPIATPVRRGASAGNADADLPTTTRPPQTFSGFSPQAPIAPFAAAPMPIPAEMKATESRSFSPAPEAASQSFGFAADDVDEELLPWEHPATADESHIDVIQKQPSKTNPYAKPAWSDEDGPDGFGVPYTIRERR